MLTLHHLNNSRSTRIIWLLEELGLDYELKSYQRGADKLAPQSLKSVHPLGKAPILQDVQDGDTITIAESGAIIEYILTSYDTKRTYQPDIGSQAWRDCQFWLHFAEGSAMPPLVMSLVFGEIPKRAPFVIKPIASAIAKQVMKNFVTPSITSTVELIESTLAKHAYFAGDTLTAADFQMSFVVEALVSRAQFAMPHARAWLAKVRARAAYQRALAKGGELKLG